MKILLLLLLPFNCFAAELIIENGKATSWYADPYAYTPASYTGIGFRSEGDQFTELLFGGWEGVNNSRFIGLSSGVRSKGKFFAEVALGGAYLLNPRTTQLDGNDQFLISVGVGGRFDNLFTTVRIRHFSNANTQGKNPGFEVIVVSIGVLF